jgi:hypothetical protein
MAEHAAVAGQRQPVAGALMAKMRLLAMQGRRTKLSKTRRTAEPPRRFVVLHRFAENDTDCLSSAKPHVRLRPVLRFNHPPGVKHLEQLDRPSADLRKVAGERKFVERSTSQ